MAFFRSVNGMVGNFLFVVSCCGLGLLSCTKPQLLLIFHFLVNYRSGNGQNYLKIKQKFKSKYNIIMLFEQLPQNCQRRPFVKKNEGLTSNTINATVSPMSRCADVLNASNTRSLHPMSQYSFLALQVSRFLSWTSSERSGSQLGQQEIGTFGEKKSGRLDVRQSSGPFTPQQVNCQK